MTGHPARTTCSEACPVPGGSLLRLRGFLHKQSRSGSWLLYCTASSSAGRCFSRPFLLRLRTKDCNHTYPAEGISSARGIKGALLRYASMRGFCQNIDPTVCWAGDVPHRLGLSVLACETFWKGPWKKSPEQIFTMRTNCWSCGRGTILGQCRADLRRESPSWEHQLSYLPSVTARSCPQTGRFWKALAALQVPEVQSARP